VDVIQDVNPVRVEYSVNRGRLNPGEEWNVTVHRFSTVEILYTALLPVFGVKLRNLSLSHVNRHLFAAPKLFRSGGC